MTDKSETWHQGNVNWQNDALVKLAEKLNSIARLAIQEKIDKVKQHANAEAARINHPTMTELAKKINEIDII